MKRLIALGMAVLLLLAAPCTLALSWLDYSRTVVVNNVWEFHLASDWNVSNDVTGKKLIGPAGDYNEPYFIKVDEEQIELCMENSQQESSIFLVITPIGEEIDFATADQETIEAFEKSVLEEFTSLADENHYSFEDVTTNVITPALDRPWVSITGNTLLYNAFPYAFQYYYTIANGHVIMISISSSKYYNVSSYGYMIAETLRYLPTEESLAGLVYADLAADDTSGAGIIFGAFPIFTTLFVRYGGDVDTFNLYGFVLTVVLLAAYIAVTKRSFAVPKKAVLWIILAGIANVVTRILLTYSYQHLDVGIATTLHFMYPLFAALLGVLCFREKMPAYKWIAFVVASASVSLFATGFENGGQFMGILLAVGSAVCFALYMLITEKANLTEIDPVVFVFYVSLVSAVGCLAMGIGGGSLIVAVPVKALIVLLLCAILNNVVGFALQQQGVKYLGAAMTALFSLFEPVFSCIFGAIFLQQAMGIKSVFGIVIILLCLVAIVALDHRRAKPYKENP